MGKKKAKQMSVHHLVPKIRGGLSTEDNLLRLDRKRHDAWHKLFGEMTLREVIAALMRIERRRRKLGIETN